MNNIKLKVFSIFLSVLSLCLISVCAYADKKEAIKSASEYDYPPYCLVSKDGRADGFSVELLRAALSAVDLGVEFKTGPWEQLKNELSEGTIQVLPLVGRTPEREAIYDFTFPYLSAHGAIFVRKGETRIKTVGDLADKTVVVMRGDNAEEYVRRKNISFNIITVDTYTEAFQLLNEGKYDAVIAQRLMGLQLLQNMKINTVISLDFIIHDFRQDFCFAVRDGDKELLSLLNEGLSIVIADGTFDKLQKRWFGPLLKHPLTFNDVMRYVLIVLIPISVIFILASVFLLRREVRNKTKNLHQEIAERKRSEEALQLSEVKFRSLAEQSITGTCIIQDGRFIYVNPRLAEILDFSQEEMIGMSVLDSVAESDRNMVRENIRKRLSGEISFIRYTFNALKKDGSSVPMEVHGSTMIYNGRPAIIATLLDITKRKQAEEAIFKEHNFNQLIIASAGEGICVCHEVGEFPYVRFTIWNDHMTAMTGYSMEEINRLGWYQSMYPDPVLQEQAIERMQRMRIGDNLQGEEWEITRADGQKRRLLITTNIISSGEGKPHILAVMNDITERKKAENALREAKEEIERWNRELENRVNEKTAELERTHKQLIQSEK
ncbi:MAG: transporter substrate-binding domain-containing protein, partial [Nitrospirae bacterium]|nr:transporter substrate-binding domain-containing protein [Nitrospirota bacterium]